MNTQLTSRPTNTHFTPAFEATKENVELVKDTVAKDATDTELRLFLHLAQKYDLDPFAKEIWFIKYKDGKDKSPHMYTSRDGYLKIAHRSGVFDGMESYTIDDDQGRPVKAVCAVYRKDMSRPFKAEIKVSEYRQDTRIWLKYPSALAIKTAEVFALKRAFSISGLITTEEIAIKSEPVEDIPVTNMVSQQLEHPTITQRQRVRLHTVYGKNGWKPEQAKAYLEAQGFSSSSDIPQGPIYDGLVEYFENNSPSPFEELGDQ